MMTMSETPTVAPRAGAWIETNLPDGEAQVELIAPRAGGRLKRLQKAISCNYGLSLTHKVVRR